MKPVPVHSIEEVPYVDLSFIPVKNDMEAKKVLDNGEYTKGWYYSRFAKNNIVRWLIVKKSEYERNQY